MNNTQVSPLTDLQTFQLAVASSSDHIVITDTEGSIVYANHAAELVTGYTTEEMQGKTPRLWGGLMDKPYYEGMWKTLKTDKKPFVSEIRNRKKSGAEYSAILRASPILSENGILIGFVATEEDISERVRIDKAKSEFVSLASHQLRSPLTVINWYTELLLQEKVGPLTDDQKNYIHQIRESSRSLTSLVTSLLNVSRIELGTFLVTPKPTDVNRFIRDTVTALQPLADAKQIRIESSYDPSIGTLDMDQNLLRIIIQNLVTNAITYTANSGTITITTVKTADSIQISVRDTGCGIPESARDRIFTKLYRADNAKSLVPNGNGLGLYIVKSVLDSSGGTIRFESEEGKGTTFFIGLPLIGMKAKEGSKMLE
jgi:PAS domain S-box-containing protein